MSRSRVVKPEFFFDEEMAGLPYEARLFFIGLWCEADREGRLAERPKKLKAKIFPYDKTDAAKLLLTLAPKFITRYSVDGAAYIQIVNFQKHQNVHKKEAVSVIPKPPAQESPGKTGLDPEKPTHSCSYSCSCSLSNSDSKTLARSPSADAEDSTPSVFEFQTNGPVTAWTLEWPKVREWQATYPGVNVTAEARKARQWLIDNPGKRKTARGMPAFLGRWIARVQDSSQAMSVDVKGPKCASCGFHGVKGGKQVCDGCGYCGVCGVGAARAKMYTKRRADGTVSVRCLEHTKSGGKHG